jgi:hypothetical protein
MGSNLMTQLTSIGTLFAFVLVSGGVLVLPRITGGTRGFKLPYWNGRYVMPFLYAGFLWLFKGRIASAVQHLGSEGLEEVLFLIFLVLVTGLFIATMLRKLSLIPVLGVLFCAYLLIEIPAIAWKWFFVWMAVGLIIYFMYGYRKSRLGGKSIPSGAPQPPRVPKSSQ